MPAEERLRKLAAILVSDVVGYSHHMETDEAGTLTMLEVYRRELIDPTIALHHGHTVKLMGDGALVEFTSVVDAVNCAIAIQTGMFERNHGVPGDTRIELRIGVHLGDIIVDHEDIYGHGVNLAARLEGLAEPGGICLSQQAYDQVETKLTLKIEDLGPQQVKNITRAVHAYRVLLDHSDLQPSSDRISAQVDDPILSLPTAPSVAVLPFDNMSADPEHEHFADGLSEDIITGLSRFSDLFVIARNSTFQYKNKAIDVRQVGKELNVRYVVEGSVRIVGDRVRVTAQLLDTTSGGHLWADTFDRKLTATDLFDLQDDIREHIVAEVAGGYGAIARTMIAKMKAHRPKDLDTYSCILGARNYYREFSAETHLEARDSLEKVVRTSPVDAEVQAWLALMLLDEWRFGYNPRADVQEPLERAVEHARRAVALNPDSQDAQYALSKIQFHRKEKDQFFTHAERALAINPNNAFILADAGLYMALAGKWKRGVSLVSKAAQLNPSHPGWYHIVFFIDQYQQGQYEAALAEALEIETPAVFFNFVFLAAAYGQLGRRSEAQEAIASILKANPDIRTNLREEFRKYNVPEPLIEHIADGLKKAGLDIPEEAQTTPR